MVSRATILFLVSLKGPNMPFNSKKPFLTKVSLNAHIEHHRSPEYVQCEHWYVPYRRSPLSMYSRPPVSVVTKRY